MTDPTSDVIAALAATAAVYAVVSGEVRAKRQRKAEEAEKLRRRAMGPAKELREALVGSRTTFNEIGSMGGRDKSYFLDREKKMTGQNLLDLVNQLEDVELTSYLDQAGKAWDQAAALAPPKRGGGLVNLSAPPSDALRKAEEARAGLYAEQTDRADEGIKACNDALGRLNALERE
jgi:hypothetical protein